MSKITKYFNKSDILTIPNMLSFVRLLFVPVIIWLYCVLQNYLAAVILILVSALTDVVDGFIARRFNMVSNFGKIIDPIADKVTQGTMIICLITRYKIMWALLAVFILREIFMAVSGILTIRATDRVNSAKWFGKLNTVLLHTVIMVLILFVNIPTLAVNILSYVCIMVMVLSAIGYGIYYFGICKQESKKAANPHSLFKKGCD